MKRPSEDPAVALVEQILDAAAERHSSAEFAEGKRNARNAFWICACVTKDDAPSWLIYYTLDDALVWQRVPDDLQWDDLVEAQAHAGGRADPQEVLRWLRGEVDIPDWNGGWIGGDHKVLRELRAKILV